MNRMKDLIKITTAVKLDSHDCASRDWFYVDIVNVIISCAGLNAVES